jgi:ribose transport system ATP-binding protein
MEQVPLLEMKGITKRFPGVLALNAVNFNVMPGEVHALVGENGAGKSTLMKILGGAYTADSGEIWLNGERLALHSPKDAIDKGINVVHQELILAPHLSAAENILMGRYPLRNHLMVDWKKLRQTAQEVVDGLGVAINVTRPIRSLTIAQQQVIEIARALQRRSNILVLDEPSAVLGKHDIEMLYQVIRRLKSQGISVVYISHRLEEIFLISDRVTVLKDGVLVGTRPTRDLESSQLLQMMIGRQIENLFNRAERTPGKVALRIEGFSRKGAFEDISFEVRDGEILGIAGLVGSGRTEVVRAIAGADRPDRGTLIIGQKQVHIRSPRHALSYGIGLLPEDRKNQGLFLNRSLGENISISSLKEYLNFIYLNLAQERKAIAGYMKTLDIQATGPHQLAANLSGGNKQKAIIARWLGAKSKILIFDEPTRGIDVGAKMEIYRLMDELAGRGVAIIMVSSEILEVLGMSDNILVMWRGKAAGYFSRAEATEEKVLEAALLGGNNHHE